MKPETGPLSITTSCGELVFAPLTTQVELSDKKELEIETYEGFLFFFIYLVFFDYALPARLGVLRLRRDKEYDRENLAVHLFRDINLHSEMQLIRR